MQPPGVLLPPSTLQDATETCIQVTALQKAVSISNQKTVEISGETSISIPLQKAIQVTNQKTVEVTNQKTVEVTNQEAVEIPDETSISIAPLAQVQVSPETTVPHSPALFQSSPQTISNVPKQRRRRRGRQTRDFVPPAQATKGIPLAGRQKE